MLARPRSLSYQPAAADRVVLLSERRAEPSGRVHEIGARARVIDRHDDLLLLDVDGETVSCPVSLVAPHRARRARPVPRWSQRGGVTR